MKKTRYLVSEYKMNIGKPDEWEEKCTANTEDSLLRKLLDMQLDNRDTLQLMDRYVRVQEIQPDGSVSLVPWKISAFMKKNGGKEAKALDSSMKICRSCLHFYDLSHDTGDYVCSRKRCVGFGTGVCTRYEDRKI